MRDGIVATTQSPFARVGFDSNRSGIGISFNFIRDIAPVIGLVRGANIMEVHPSVPVANVPDFIAYAKANPGKLNMASAGNGSTSHIYGELFKMMTEVNVLHVPYRGSGPALTDLLGGQVEVMFDNMGSSIEHVRAGRLRALGVTAATRLKVLPNIPPVGDFVPGYEATSVGGFGLPRGTPANIVDKLSSEINAGLADPEVKARIAELGVSVVGGSPREFGEIIAYETEKWGKVVKFAGIKAD
jgi:tripartite-type tricarboxylate transporter receptor subunit TctC